MQVDRPIAAAIILFIILLLVFFFVMPEYKTFKKLQADLGEKKAEFNAEFDYYAEITKTYFNLKNQEEDIKKVDTALPEEPNLGNLVYFFQKVAGENGMIVKDLFLSKSSAVKDSEGVDEVVFSVDLIGDYASLGNFLASLEESARIFEVINISFGSESPVLILEELNQFQSLRSYAFNLQIKTHSY